MNSSRIRIVLALLSCGLAAASAQNYCPPVKNLPFPVYTNAPAGPQMSGQHAPASTPALSPAEAQKKFTLPPGFEIRLFASEPEVVNPVAMTWDERGRLWVLELYEYPLGAKPGEKPRDRIKILEDIDGDGVADKVTVFADGLNLATGLALGNGGVYVGQAPDFLFLKDTDGDGKADTREVIKTGFGMEDRHELLNGFIWGPDGWLYMTHGVFTLSKVVDPAAPKADPVVLTAGVARFHPLTRKFEVFAEGTSNPWGVDFDSAGNAFVSACVIEHLFHLAPGGIYDRQAGQPPNPYAYELLHSINDHKHKMAAYSGICVYQGGQFDLENVGTILQGNIHDNAIHQDRLTPNGSSFTATKWRDLVRGDDGWFMPVSTQVGPDGAVWIMDWYDKYPCYQNANADPAGVDREHGRIWRVVHTGAEKGKAVPSRPSRDMNLAALSGGELVSLLADKNEWQRRTAQRLLQERRDSTTQAQLQNLLASGSGLDAKLAAAWTLHSSGLLDSATLRRCASLPEPALRAWAARFIGERGDASEETAELMASLARDPDPSVRLAVAVAVRQFTSSQLTVDRPPVNRGDVGGILVALVESSADAKDPVLPFMIWQAAEPVLLADLPRALDWFADEGHRHMPLAGILAGKGMRRICDAGNPRQLDAALEFIGRIASEHAALAEYALEGLIKGQEGKALTPSSPVGPFLEKLRASGSPKIAELARKLGTLWGDATALKATLARTLDASLPESDRIAAIQTARKTKSESARGALLQLLARKEGERVQLETIAALGEIGGGGEVGQAILNQWKNLGAAARRAASETLSSRFIWRSSLFAGLQEHTISPSDLSPSLIRSLVNHEDEGIRDRALRLIGRFRAPGADKLKLIAEKRKMVLEGQPDLKAGREVAKLACFTCHKLHGEGAEVGPDLTGVGRSSLDALLANVIDPNQIIGAGYENVEVETKDGRTVAGRMVENTDSRVRLLQTGPKEEVISKSDVKSLRVSELSVMPEGLEQLPDADFRNLIWFILAPPQDGPLTDEKRKALIGGGHSAGTAKPSDGESVALWNPEWRVSAPDFEGTPAKYPEFAGRRNVLATHPYDEKRAAALERDIELPADKKAVLSFAVAAHEKGDWELRVTANGRELRKQIVGHDGERWTQVRVDLSPFAGRKVALRLENRANGWSWEFAYWSDLKIETGSQSVVRK
jgi:putative membrane-bound dehydrogenase-like protein